MLLMLMLQPLIKHHRAYNCQMLSFHAGEEAKMMDQLGPTCWGRLIGCEGDIKL